jgi:carbonic anhydrase
MQTITPDQALEKLMVGNRRYVAGRALHPRQSQAQRDLLLESQHPFAAILSCSDSRVPSELIFDQGLGDLFIVRTAGHVTGDLVIGTLEFAVHVLHVPLIMVMGHTQCGAVAATIAGQSLPGRIGSIASDLQPAVDLARSEPGDQLLNAIHTNSRYTADKLIRESAILGDAIEKGALKIVPAYFDLKTSSVHLLQEG